LDISFHYLNEGQLAVLIKIAMPLSLRLLLPLPSGDSMN